MLLFIYAYFQGKPRIVNFNTSHVTVYPGRTQNVRHLNEISIHLMLLFIVKVAGHKDDPLKFQYISCYCLSIPSADIASVTISFQYISCYCLSKSEIVGEVNLTYFNTSHVTVYPFHTCIKFFLCEFQYISCYCLSNGFPPFSIFLFPTNPLYLRFFSFLPSILLESFLYSIITYISLIFKLF